TVPLSTALGMANTALSAFGGQIAIPQAQLNSSLFAGAQAEAMGKVAQLDAQRPTPMAGLNSIPFVGGILNSLGMSNTLAGQRPTPQAFLGDQGFKQAAAALMLNLHTIANQKIVPVATLMANTGAAEAALNWAARNRTSYVFQQVITKSATGGAIDDAVSRLADGGGIFAGIGLAAGGGVSGPGGPLDDLIPAMGPGGARYQLSNGEHVLDARDVDLMGGQGGVYAFRDALNAGRTQVIQPKRMADGGPVATTPREAGAPAPVAPAASITINGGITIKVETPFNLMNDRDLRRAALAIEQELITITRGRM
ncbi:hypothetical protein E4P40_20440, partial [Blastococcus sp. CT_GayMR20]|uniref:hypothetical protein n=1 Tax=Blastococcus sp. CT_GayMR20 TaxID=2559609 RepID=UPI001104ABC8